MKKRAPSAAPTLFDAAAAALPVLRPEWAAPPTVQALVTTRQGGVSQGPWASMNVSRHVGDEPDAVAHNRRLLAQHMGVPIVWLNLEHGAEVFRASHLELQQRTHGAAPVADAAWTTDANLACAVTAADCMPVFFSTHDGAAVAVAHAGWRGLAAGVLGNTVRTLCQGAGCAPTDIHAWLGPCIGPLQFEVSSDVLAAFQADISAPDEQRFRPRPRPDGSARWLANLPQLARDALGRAGVGRITGGELCTVQDASRFFSYRRDGVTGRMLAAIWRTGD